MTDLTEKAWEDIADSIIDTMYIDDIYATLHSLIINKMEAMEADELEQYLADYGIKA